MIDEKKLVEAIKDKKITIGGLTRGDIWTAGFVEMHNKIIDEIIEIVNDQPKIGEWIPVEKGLPKEDGQYLVYYSCEIDGSIGEDKECGYSVEYFDTDAQSFGYYQKRFDPVTLGFIEEEFVKMETAIAWMPLPERYGGNENEQN